MRCSAKVVKVVYIDHTLSHTFVHTLILFMLSLSHYNYSYSYCLIYESFLNIFSGSVGKPAEPVRIRDCALEMDWSSFPFRFCICSPLGGKQMKVLENLECLVGLQRLWGSNSRTDLKTGFSPFFLS